MYTNAQLANYIPPAIYYGATDWFCAVWLFWWYRSLFEYSRILDHRKYWLARISKKWPPGYLSTPEMSGFSVVGSVIDNLDRRLGSPNTSGQGAMARLPDELQGWNWGAFWFGWIWAVGMNTWIGLLALVPYVGWVMWIVLGIKGNEWAWQNRRWDSIQQFREMQSKWAKWIGWSIIAGGVIAIMFAVVYSMSQG